LPGNPTGILVLEAIPRPFPGHSQAITRPFAGHSQAIAGKIPIPIKFRKIACKSKVYGLL